MTTRKLVFYALAFFVLTCVGTHRVWHGRGEGWFWPLFTAGCCGVNLGRLIERKP